MSGRVTFRSLVSHAVVDVWRARNRRLWIAGGTEKTERGPNDAAGAAGEAYP